MRIPINLASRPFERNRTVLAASTAIAVLLTLVLALLSYLAIDDRNQMRGIREAIDKTERQLTTISAEQAKLETAIRKPENAEVFERSILLNVLLARKGISWTRLFSDLEQVLPHNVRLVSIRPQVNGQNAIVLDMVVGAQSPEPVIDLLKRLEDSKLFSSASLASSLPPSQTDPLFRYRVSVNYAQKL